MKPKAAPKIVHSIRPCSRGFSVRNLPPASLQTIREITDYYEKKASGDYESLSTRYLYLMIQELRHVLAELEANSIGDLKFAKTFMDEMKRGNNTNNCSNRDNSVFHNTDTSRNIPAPFHCCNHGSWSERTSGCAISHTEFRHAVEYLEANLDSATKRMYDVQQDYEAKLKAQETSFRKIIANERTQFEGLYGRMKEQCDSELRQSKAETASAKQDAQDVISMVHRDSHHNVCAVKAAHAREIEELMQKHTQNVESLKADHANDKDRTAELLAKARRDQTDAVDKARQDLMRKHQTEMLSMRQEAAAKAAKAARSSKENERETVLGPDGVELLARIIQNKESARDVLVESLFERQARRPTTSTTSRRSSCSKGIKRHTGNVGPTKGPGALFSFQPAENERPSTAPSKDRWRY